MNLFIIVIGSIFVLVHALIHLMGTTVYMKLGQVEGLEYKTTLLNGLWDLGEKGIWGYGLLWGLAAAGFIIAMIVLWFKWDLGIALMAGAAIFSLVLTALDYQSAFMGVIANIIILAVIVLGPQIKTLIIN